MVGLNEKLHRVVLVATDGTEYTVNEVKHLIILMKSSTGACVVSSDGPDKLFSLYSEDSSPYTFCWQSSARKFMEMLITAAKSSEEAKNLLKLNGPLSIGPNPEHEHIYVNSIRVERKPDTTSNVVLEHVFSGIGVIGDG